MASARTRSSGARIAARSDASIGSIRSIAAARYERKTLGALSKSSSVSHATGRVSCAAHSASRTVLLYPGGPITDATGRRGSADSLAISRWRGTVPSRLA
jgi:hypothetical protein